MIQEKMMSRTLRSVFAGSMLVGMSAMMHNAMAQEAAPAKIEQVQVTGTRITSPGMSSTSPISSVTAEEMRASQPVAVEEFIKSLPVAVASIGPGTNVFTRIPRGASAVAHDLAIATTAPFVAA